MSIRKDLLQNRYRLRTVLGTGGFSTIYLAIDIYRHRLEFDEPLANPLKKLYHEKKDDSEKVRFAIPKKHENSIIERAPRGNANLPHPNKDSQAPASAPAQPSDSKQPTQEEGPEK